jgi:hypothetical protein
MQELIKATHDLRRCHMRDTLAPCWLHDLVVLAANTALNITYTQAGLTYQMLLSDWGDTSVM